MRFLKPSKLPTCKLLTSNMLNMGFVMCRALNLLVICFVIIPLAPLKATTQTNPSTLSRIKLSTLKKQPNCHIGESKVNGRNVFIRWKCGKKYVLAYITVHPSVKEASDRFNALSSELDDSLEGKGAKIKVPEIAEENFLWTGYYNIRGASLHFRKGNTHVIVSAPSVITIKDFAKIIAEQIIVP